MKLILFFAHTFSYKTASKGLQDVADLYKEESIDNAVVVFFHVEESDEKNFTRSVQKFVKNTKWLCGKFKTKNVVLHSFNHLSLSKAPPAVAQNILDAVSTRLKRAEYAVTSTPFGYFNEFKIHVGGDSLAKVYKEF